MSTQPNIWEVTPSSRRTSGLMTTKDHGRDPSIKERTGQGKGKYANNFWEMIIVCMFLLGKLTNMQVKYSGATGAFSVVGMYK